MSIEQQIASLTTATTDLLSAVNVKKAALDSSVLDAQNYALSASADKDQTAADRIQTGLDRIATGEDRLATGADRVQTSADRVQTGLDAQASAADRIKTTADAAATAADRAQTSLDASTSTAAADTSTGAAAAALNSANNAATSASAATTQATSAQAARTSAEAARDAAIVAQNNAVAVVTGGTATLVPAAGKIPLADANAKIAEGWLTSTALVEQTDIGTAPNEIPLNQYLGNLAYMNSDQFVLNPVASATPIGVGDLVFQLTNDTTLVVKVKGSDGTVRSATLTLA